MLSKKMLLELNNQIKYEIYSAYYYLSMAAYLDDLGLPGFANFFKIQFKEELDHAMKFYHYVNEQGGRVILQQIDQPKTEFKSPEEIFKLSYEHEQFVTKRIYLLMDIAKKEKDYSTESFLKWFVDEQVEEEATMKGYLDKIKLVGGKGQGLLMIDAELGSRVYHPPVAEEE